MLGWSFAVKIFCNDNALVEFSSLRIGPDRIAYLDCCPDSAGLNPTLAVLGPDWIPENESVSYFVAGGRAPWGSHLYALGIHTFYKSSVIDLLVYYL